MFPASSTTVTVAFNSSLSPCSGFTAETIVPALQRPESIAAATAGLPPNWVKSTSTADIPSGLFSPVEVLSHMTRRDSPTCVVESPVEMFPLVTTGGMLSTVAFEVSAVVVDKPAISVAVTETFTSVASIAPATTV